MLQASQVASPAEEAGYVNPDARQHPFRYIPPGFLIESSGRCPCRKGVVASFYARRVFRPVVEIKFLGAC